MTEAEVLATRLDTLRPLQSRVGYGSLGTGGSLGYEGKRITVGGVAFSSALSTHPPARLLYHLGGSATRFHSRVAINDDVGRAGSWADFSVVVDGRVVAEAHRVRTGEPRALEADVTGGYLLELLVSTSRWDYSHAVWLDPQLEGALPLAQDSTMVDPLRRVEIDLPPELPEVERCIATIASPGWAYLLDDMLGSLAANGGCPDARVAVFVIDGDDECEHVIAKYRALPVRCRALARTGMASKSALYSVGHVVPARGYVCLDADMLIVDDLSPLFAAIDACPEGSVLACREGNGHHYRDVEHVLERVYGGRPDDITRILGADDEDARRYPLPVNDGTFAGSRTALLTLDAAIRGMPGAIDWLEANRRVAWRNQFLFNLALARLRCGVELDERYNLQLNGSDADVQSTAGPPRVSWQGRGVRVLHANGWGRNKYPQLRGLYAKVPDPLVGQGDGDLYADFLKALRAWIGRYGVTALGYSFQGVLEEDDARVRDPSTLPTLALLHYLARASGWARVLETGTARGVSAACLASAVSHRPGSRVVSYDPVDYPERGPLWEALPERMRGCIEQRQVDALVGMREALERGERYEGALLDSQHTEEQVAAELELALALVEPGGLVLIHDWRAISAVDAAVARADAAGHPLARLLGGGSVAEDDGLGLAAVTVR